ncbi:MAG: DUF1573 domain-containing protein [Marinilabiliaceae bacterium]|nr:DUF1573 domain-containing protein [Marinilabiliaceae bacterium]
MRIVMMLLGMLIVNYSCFRTTQKTDFTEIEFDNRKVDVGSINVYDSVQCNFSLKNCGDTLLIINNVISSCGCTVPSWMKDPIEVDSIGKIEIIYKSEMLGEIDEGILVYFNGKSSPVHLSIEGVVIESK